MAVVKLYEGFRQSKNEVFDLDSFSLRDHTGEAMTYSDRRGASVVMAGHDLTYEDGQVSGGVIDSVVKTNKHDEIIFTAKNLDLSGSTFAYYVDRDGGWATDYVFVMGDDKITGSSSNDIIQSELGDDVVYGKGGADYIYIGWGNDTVYGGAGNDVFHFMAKYTKSMTIGDFEDHGSRQDVIGLDKKFYNHMDVHQRGDDVVLSLGNHKIVIEDYDRHDLDRDDFYLF